MSVDAGRLGYVVDFDELEAAGIANARKRAALIEYLDSLGFTVEDMVEAERRGRLFGLAGDAVQESGRLTHSLRTAAEALGAPLDDVVDAWAMLGRAGLGYGTVLAINGDYFGNAVNLAARLVAAAAPRQILGAATVHDALPDWPAIAQDPLTLKGFDAPVTAFDMSRHAR